MKTFNFRGKNVHARIKSADKMYRNEETRHATKKKKTKMKKKMEVDAYYIYVSYIIHA